MTDSVTQLKLSSPMKSLFLAQPPQQWKDFIERHPDQAGDEPTTETLSETFLRRAINVNRLVNALFYKKDLPGRDVWELLSNSDSGDCEDLALTKRMRLAELGHSLGALRPVICETEKKELHAVLCLVTDLGDYIADNRFPFIAPWESVPYFWRYRWAGAKHWELLGNAKS